MKTYRLIGPPGCGKTHALSTKWLPRAVELHGIENVIICSLTKAAAREVASRVDLPKDQVGTLHSFAFRALGKPPIAIDKNMVKSWNDSQPPMWHVTGKSRRNNLDMEFSDSSTDKLEGDDLLNESGVYRNKLVPLGEWDRPVRTFYDEWLQWKRRMQCLDYTDLIELPPEFGTRAPGIPAVIICDEAQDFTELDMQLINHWGVDAEFVVLTGDYNQAIFTFRGASPKAFLPDSVADDEVTVLGQSYRVPEKVKDYASEWIKQDTEHRVFDYKGRVGKDGKTVQGVIAATPHMSLGTAGGRARLISDIKKRVAKDHTCMILATCRYMLGPMLSAMRSAGLPFHNPYRPAEGAWNPMRGGTERLHRFLTLFDGSKQAWTWEDLRKWGEPLMAKTFLRHGSGAEIERQAKRHCDDECPTDGELRLLLKPEEHWLLMEMGSPEEALAWYEPKVLASKRNSMRLALKLVADYDVESLVQVPKVTVGTIHSVKGGSSEYVYLSPDIGRSGGREWLDLSKPEGRNAIVRSMYVGITRASEGVALLSSNSPDRVKWI